MLNKTKRNSKNIDFLSFIYAGKLLYHIYINLYQSILYNLYNVDGFVAKNDNDSIVIQFASINVFNNIRSGGGPFRSGKEAQKWLCWLAAGSFTMKPPVALARYFYPSR